MAETYGFFDAEQLVDGTYDREYLAEQWANYFKLFISNGVFSSPTNQLKVIAYSGMFVKISPGWAFINGYWYHVDVDLEIEVPSNVTASPVVDGVYIRWDSAEREIKARIGVGQTTPNRVAPYYEIKLAEIAVATGATQITDANITDTRMDSSVCGLVTGIINVIDAGSLFAQYQSIFDTWMNSTDVTFDTWRDHQEETYAQWYAAIQAKMNQNLEDFDTWFEAIKGQLSTDAAGHLQNEIDDIIAQGLSGSIFRITTTQTELYGKDVTITGANDTKTGKFNSQGVAVITGFTDVGTINISSTDGLEIASTTMNIPYFGRYSASIAFWAATVNIQGDENLYGYTVTVKDSGNITVGTVVLSAIDGTGTFTATRADTYSFTVTYEGQAISETLVVSAQTTYSVSISAGFSYKTWCTEGGVDATQYSSLADVLADGLAVHRLMTVHASADYLIGAVSDDINTIDDFCANDTAMKWIGLRDYVCDGLTAINGVETKFLASQYWERYLKDHVPIMTANNAPYGTLTGDDGTSGHDIFKAFDGDDNTYWQTQATGHNVRGFTYAFVNPTCVKRVKIRCLNAMTEVNILVGNTASNLTVVKEVASVSANEDIIIDVPNDSYCMYISVNGRVDSGATEISTLQFYGRSLNVSVPVMTGNTAPYGEAKIFGSNNPAFNTFSQDSSKLVGSENIGTTPLELEYDFISKVCIKGMLIKSATSQRTGYKPWHMTLKGSDDGFNTQSEVDNVVGSNNITAEYFDISNVSSYKDYRLTVNDAYSGTSTSQASTNYCNFDHLQFYGLDYSEREFEPNTNKKWLYDHGLNLGNLEEYVVNPASGDGVTFESDYIDIHYTGISGGGRRTVAKTSMDLTNYELIKAVIDDFGASSLLLGVFSSDSSTAQVDLTKPFNYLNISSVDSDAVVQIGRWVSGNTGYGKVKELWLE